MQVQSCHAWLIGEGEFSVRIFEIRHLHCDLDEGIWTHLQNNMATKLNDKSRRKDATFNNYELIKQLIN